VDTHLSWSGQRIATGGGGVNEGKGGAEESLVKKERGTKPEGTAWGLAVLAGTKRLELPADALCGSGEKEGFSGKGLLGESDAEGGRWLFSGGSARAAALPVCRGRDGKGGSGRKSRGSPFGKRRPGCCFWK